MGVPLNVLYLPPTKTERRTSLRLVFRVRSFDPDLYSASFDAFHSLPVQQQSLGPRPIAFPISDYRQLKTPQ
eukprot:1013977-Prorocentrum_minimum.AAC.2